MSVSKIIAKITKSANSEAPFSDTRSETISIQFYVDFGSIFGGLVHKNRKETSQKPCEKKVAKKSCEMYKRFQDSPGQGGALTMIRDRRDPGEQICED